MVKNEELLMFSNSSLQKITRSAFLLLLFTVYAHAHIPFRIISLPVTGTHLLEKTISMILEPHEGWDNPGLATFHAMATRKNIEKSLQAKHKIIFNMRDPRDRIVSYAFKLKNYNPQLSKDIQHKSIKELSWHVITRYGEMTSTYLWSKAPCKNMKNFSEYYRAYIPWLEYPEVLIVYFENLVGPQAGGSTEKQIIEIKKIAKFLEVPVSDHEAATIAANIYGDTASFRKPQIGIWKEYFGKKHRKAFKSTIMAKFLIDFGYAEDNDW